MRTPFARPKDLPTETQKFYREAPYFVADADTEKVEHLDRLVTANLATTRRRDERKGANVHYENVHPLYNHFVGSGNLHIRVYITEPDDFDGRTSRQLLAVLHGAQTRQDRSSHAGTMSTIVCHHPTATDIEHDASQYAQFGIRNLLTSDIGVLSTYSGVFTNLRMWPWGTELTEQHDGGIPPGMCENEHCDPHPFAPFLPPEREDMASLRGYGAVLDVTPKALVKPNGKITF